MITKHAQGSIYDWKVLQKVGFRIELLPPEPEVRDPDPLGRARGGPIHC